MKRVEYFEFMKTSKPQAYYFTSLESWKRLFGALLNAGVLLSIPAQAIELQRLSLDQTLYLVRKNAKEAKPYQYHAESARHAADAAYQVYDTHLYLDSSVHKDKKLEISLQSADIREQEIAKLGVRKQFSTSTSFDLAYTFKKTNLTFSPFDPSLPSALNPELNIRENPAYEASLSLEVRQDLWRNFWGNEVDLERELLRSNAYGPEHRALKVLQQVQGQTELLVWNLLAAHEYRKNTILLLDTTRAFANLTRERRSYGRGDDVDIATADGLVIERQGDLADLNWQIKEFGRAIAHRIGKPNTKVDAPRFNISFWGESRQRERSVAKLLQVAKANHPDVKRAKKMVDAEIVRFQLAREKSKPWTYLFASAAVTGFAEDGETAFENSTEDKYTTTTVGLGISVPLGSWESYAGKNRAKSSRAAQLEEIELIHQSLGREISLMLIKLEGAESRLKQAYKEIGQLEEKKASESKKIDQARNDRIVLVQYDLEILARKARLIEATHSMRLIETQLKMLMHLYPKT